MYVRVHSTVRTYGMNTCSAAYVMLPSTYRVLVPEVLVLQLGRFLSRQAVVPAAEHHVTAAVVAVAAVHQAIANAATRAVNNNNTL